MSAIFDFSSLITVLLLLICTCAYLRELRPNIFDTTKAGEPVQHTGFPGMLWKFSRIGERLSPYVGFGCLLMGLHVLFFKK